MKKQKGIGLLELMLALVIISVLLVAATRYFSSTDSSRKVNTAADILQAVINASEDVKMAGNSYELITNTQYLKDRGLLPADWTATSNPWGGDIQVVGAATEITLTLTNVPAKDCLALKDLMVKKGVTDGNCGSQSYTYSGKYSS